MAQNVNLSKKPNQNCEYLIIQNTEKFMFQQQNVHILRFVLIHWAYT